MTVTAPELTLDDVRDQILARRAAEDRALTERPEVVVEDSEWLPISNLRGELAAEFDDIANDAGEGEFTIPAEHLLTEWLLRPSLRMSDVHITVRTKYREWNGKCDFIQRIMKAGEMVAVRVHFLHDYNRAKKLICYANPATPAEVQTPHAMPFAGPSITGINTYGLSNMWRVQSGIWQPPAEILNPASWLEGFDPDNWWTTMVPNNPVLDTSRWSVLSSRFANFHDLIKPTLADAGLVMRAERWWPGDPQPAPGFYTLQDHSVRVFKVYDKSGVRGPSGTFIDGLLTLIGTTAEDYINEIVSQVSRPDVPEYKIAKWFGTRNDSPWVAFPEGKYSTVRSSEMTIHKAMAYAMITGGKSPQWVNSLTKLAANAALGYLGAAIGNPGLALGVFDFMVEDVFLAFHRMPNTVRRSLMGPDADWEHWVQGPGVGFTLSTLQAIRTGFWDTRGYTSFTAEIDDRAPYIVGKHFDLGDRIAFEIGGELYIDNVTRINLKWDRNTLPVNTITIGDGQAEEEPAAKLMRYKENIMNLIQQQGVAVS
ncbi:minor tail protein [Gordonia phage Reyja]|uniref:Minor tail protein n=1 Tax=Gordonia phage Reyja TaxID=2571250 RepID=A0A4D6T7X9_9CAUD|nr:minor tail protein [Gordonia phage Reyja]QCG77765.1 minor tail protein [Gordonia phage Reyja]